MTSHKELMEKDANNSLVQNKILLEENQQLTSQNKIFDRWKARTHIQKSSFVRKPSLYTVFLAVPTSPCKTSNKHIIHFISFEKGLYEQKTSYDCFTCFSSRWWLEKSLLCVFLRPFFRHTAHVSRRNVKSSQKRIHFSLNWTA